ncbi:MAG: hypothetical protein HS107_14075 [Thermoflexaceae bacterium]|nr:hypothetical protein [Thermoflexaceae bacterium]
MPAEDRFDDELDGGAPDLGPDERDLDLMDGTWEERYYSGRMRQRDWQGVYVGLALLALMGLVIPALVVLFR